MLPFAVRVRRVVHESVSGRALPGAVVWLAGSDRSAVTDPLGRWALADVPPGRVTLTYAHPALDAPGLTGLRADAVLAAGEAHTLTLAGPSFATFAGRLCGGGPLGAMSGGVRGSGPMGNLDQLPLPHRLAALEVYTRPAAIPFELNPGFTECGAVYAWTTQHAARGGR